MYEREKKQKIQKLLDNGFSYEQAIGIISYVEGEKAAKDKGGIIRTIDKRDFISHVLDELIKAVQEIKNSANQNWRDFLDNLMDQFT